MKIHPKQKKEIEIIETPIGLSENKLIDFIIEHLQTNTTLKNTDLYSKYTENKLEKITESLILLDFIESDDGKIKGQSPYNNISDANTVRLTKNAKTLKLKYETYEKYLSILRHKGIAYYLDAYGSIIGGLAGALALIISLVNACTEKKTDYQKTLNKIEHSMQVQNQLLKENSIYLKSRQIQSQSKFQYTTKNK